MKVTKIAAISEAYGKHWNRLPKDAKVKAIENFGFISSDDAGGIELINIIGNDIDLEDYSCISEKIRFYRPKSLQGIENNNGWERVDDENTKSVKDDIHYDLYDAEDDEIMYNVSGIFNVLSLVLLPAITHIRISNNKKPIYR